MKNNSIEINYEKGKQNPRKIIYRSVQKNNYPNFMPLNPSLSLPAIKVEDNRKKPYINNQKFLELKKYQNKKTSNIIKKKNYLTPSFKENIRHMNNNNFFIGKDPKETLYNSNNNNYNSNNTNKTKTISQSLIKNSYNILNNITNIKNEDHIKDLLNYGNRENLYNYIGKRGISYKTPYSNYINKNLSKMIKEKISNDEDSEYYINNGWSVMEYAFKEDPNLKNRPSMEDKSKSVDGFNNDNNSGFFCIFDGHGGSEVSSFLQKNIINYMKEFSNNLDLMFQKLDENFLNDNFNHLGSTGCLVYITKEYTVKNMKKICYCANIGDTRAVLISKERIKRISYDDRANDKNEIERVKNEGGVIFGGRVFGNLMLTRAFGDYDLKQYGVICNPHISRNEINSEDKFIVIASDGVWDVINDEEIFKISKGCKNAKEFCDLIVKNSAEKSLDNISCFVIRLN
jgi:serine/threonine protein phosphatase PrpC